MFKEVHLIIENSNNMNYFISNTVENNVLINVILPVP